MKEEENKEGDMVDVIGWGKCIVLGIDPSVDSIRVYCIRNSTTIVLSYEQYKGREVQPIQYAY